MSAAVTASVLNYEWVCVDKIKGALSLVVYSLNVTVFCQVRQDLMF